MNADHSLKALIQTWREQPACNIQAAQTMLLKHAAMFERHTQDSLDYGFKALAHEQEGMRETYAVAALLLERMQQPEDDWLEDEAALKVEP